MRAERLHHRARLNEARRFHWGRDLRQKPVVLGQVVDTPTPCSCWLCSAEKRGELSVKDLRAREAWRKIKRT